MFNAWLQNHNIADYALDERLFPAVDDRAFWQAVIPSSDIERAERFLGYDRPMIRATQYMKFRTEGDRLAQEKSHFDRREALLSLFLGELAEDKGRFLPDIVDGIFAVCEETFWGLSAHCRNGLMLPPADDAYVDLYAGETAELLSVIYHVLYERLQAFCPLILTRLEYELNVRVVQPYLAHRDWWWMGYDGAVNNWNPWVLQNVLTVLLTQPIAKDVRDAALAKTMAEIQRYYEDMPDDGGCDEGTSYWTKAGAMLFSYCDQLYHASGGAINFFGDEKLHRIGVYAARAYITDCRFVNFADGSGLIRNPDVQYALYGFGMRTGDAELCRLAGTLKRAQEARNGAKLLRGTSTKRVLWTRIYADDITAQPDFHHPAFAVLPDLQNAFLRKGAWYLAAKGGHNAENHNHNDVGSFIVYADEQPLLVDPGVGVYTRFTFSDQRYTISTMQSAFHNLPLINGVMQQNGAAFKATAFDAAEGKVDVRFGAAYPSDARVRDVQRTIVLEEDGVRVTDRFVFDGDGAVCEHFMTPLDVEIDGDSAVLGGKYRLRVAGATVEVDTMPFNGDHNLNVIWEQDFLNRVKFSTATDTVSITLERVTV